MKILSENETIDFLKKGWSLGRFGDGELQNLIVKKKNISKLQEYDPRLRKKLLEVLFNPIDNFLIGIPRMNNPKNWVKTFHSKFKKIVPIHDKLILCSAFISRPSIVSIQSEEYFENLSGIWQNRECVIVNFNTNLLSHPLIKNCERADFIKISRQNCFADYAEIYKRCLSYHKNRLFLISAGPSATCLAYDLAKYGFQSIDIGQVFFEYGLYKEHEGIEKWTSQGEYRRRI